MSSAALKTRAHRLGPSTARRRSTPLLASTVGFLVLSAAASLCLGTTPDAHATGQQVAQWFHDKGSQVRWSVWFLTLSLIFFAVFASLVRNLLPRPHRDVFFFGAVALVAETAVEGWILAGLAWHAHALAPATARTVLDVASYWGPLLNSATVLMLAPIALLAFQKKAGLPCWLGFVAGVALAEQIIETITIFGRQGFIAPGGPMNLQLGALLATIAIGCTGVVLGLSDLRSTTSHTCSNGIRSQHINVPGR